jgi:hypothetical protein
LKIFWSLISGGVCLQVMLKMKSRHVAGTITKKKKSKWGKKTSTGVFNSSVLIRLSLQVW